MDWTGCELVERVPGKMSGAPVVVGTRVPPETFVEGVAVGMRLEELHKDFPTVSRETVRRLLEFASRQSVTHKC